ncbi:MAG: nitroreductase/quinone reductase family protein [Anaerolineales bacterium]|nr:nitroreductase/quinone reductase family protein [Anaerolineales bacterium]
MEEAVRRALNDDRTIDITTVGRRTGEPHRIEIWYHNVDGDIYLSGSPGPRDWYANLLGHPEFTFHLKGSVQADLKARARPINDPQARRQILAKIAGHHRGETDLERWIESSPLVEVTFPEGTAGDG